MTDLQSNNPAARACTNIDKGPLHEWVRRADGTATCLSCGVSLTVEETREAFGDAQSISKKPGSAEAANT